jgi:hypothetical protein
LSSQRLVLLGQHLDRFRHASKLVHQLLVLLK